MDATRRRNNVIKGHRITWWVYSGPDASGRLYRIRKTSTMRGRWPGYDASCECGWDSSTGGAVKSYVQREVDFHKWEASQPE